MKTLRSRKKGDILSLVSTLLQVAGAVLMATDDKEENELKTYIGLGATITGTLVSEAAHQELLKYEVEQNVMRALIDAGIYEEV